MVTNHSISLYSKRFSQVLMYPVVLDKEMFKFHLFFFTILLLKYYSLETEPVFYSIKLESTLFIMVNTMFCEKSFSEMKSSKVYDNNDDVRQGKALASASLQHKQQ